MPSATPKARPPRPHRVSPARGVRILRAVDDLIQMIDEDLLYAEIKVGLEEAKNPSLWISSDEMSRRIRAKKV